MRHARLGRLLSRLAVVTAALATTVGVELAALTAPKRWLMPLLPGGTPTWLMMMLVTLVALLPWAALIAMLWHRRLSRT